jgi:DNA primase
LESILEEGLGVQVLNLPPGADPDDVIKKNGRKTFMALLNQAESLFDYKYKILKRDYNPLKIEGKIKIVEHMFSIISKTDNIITKNNYIKTLAQRLNLSEEAINLEFEKKIKKENSPKFTDIKTTLEIKQNSQQKTEKELLKLIIGEKRLINIVKNELDLNDITDPDYRYIFSFVFKLESKPAKEIMLYLKDNQAALNKLSDLIIDYLPDKDKEKSVIGCIKKFNQAKTKKRKKILQQEIEKASKEKDEKILKNLLKEYQELS